MSGRQIPGFLTALCSLLLITATASAQNANGSVVGVVKDASGAVLPGVTVEAASPALIERVRAVCRKSAGVGLACSRANLTGDTTFNRRFWRM